MSETYSLNNKLVLEPYLEGRTLTANKDAAIRGFATPVQKVAIIGLKLLLDARLSDGRTVKAGSLAYIKQHNLHTQEWAKNQHESDVIPSKFIIVDLTHVEFLKEA